MISTYAISYKISCLSIKKEIQTIQYMIISLWNSNLFCKIAGTIRRVKNLIVKHREIQCKAKPNWMSWWQFSICNVLQIKGTHSSITNLSITDSHIFHIQLMIFIITKDYNFFLQMSTWNMNNHSIKPYKTNNHIKFDKLVENENCKSG